MHAIVLKAKNVMQNTFRKDDWYCIRVHLHLIIVIPSLAIPQASHCIRKAQCPIVDQLFFDMYTTITRYMY